MEAEHWDGYAEEYHQEIISPFQKNVKNPLVSDIIKNDTKGMVVADIGTGRGDLLPILSDNFGKVYAIDFSDRMLNIAKKRNSGYGNVRYLKSDIRELSKIRRSFDVIISSNSILHPRPQDIRRSINEIYASLKERGLLMAIMPSMESIIYYFKLVFEREYEKCGDESRAVSRTKKIVEKRKYNLITGIYTDGGMRQKFFYKFEIENLLREAGFSIIKFDKVLYPWEQEIADYQLFEGMPEMWDWYVIGRK